MGGRKSHPRLQVDVEHRHSHSAGMRAMEPCAVAFKSDAILCTYGLAIADLEAERTPPAALPPPVADIAPR